MEFVANTVYEQRALIEGKEDELFLLEKMIEYEESETQRQDFSKRSHIEYYILTILCKICQAEAQAFSQLSEIMEAKGYSQDRFEKLIGKLLGSIRSALLAKDKQMSVWTLMLLSVVAKSSRK